MLMTSEEVYDEYQRLKTMEEKLERQNKGLSLANAEKFLKPTHFFIRIFFVAKQNLLETKTDFKIKSNFPFISWHYRYDKKGIDDFLEDLEQWCSIPKYERFIQRARKRENKVYFSYSIKTRTYDILFNQIDFEIGKQALHELNLRGFDFIGSVEKTLKLQRKATDEEERDIERFHYLLQRTDDLKRQGIRKVSYYSDEIIPKISISDEEYNKKLKEVETEMISLAEKHCFLSLPSYFKYKEEEE